MPADRERDDPMPHRTPARIGGHDILGELGRGAMGTVYRARQRSPEREVALKVVAGVGAGAAARMQREVAALARLEHPGIARLYAAGEEPGAVPPVAWLAMEYVRGVDLRAWRAAEAPDPRRVAELLVALCSAVQHAHANGIVHRDLKPDNILVDDGGQPRVLDFGIARILGPDDGATIAGQVLGSLPYMAPEQLAGEIGAVDARADIHALGVVAFELFAGRLPWPQLEQATLFEALAVHRAAAPPRLATAWPAAPADLDAIVGRAMDPLPARRYASAAELGADLSRWLDHRPVEARPPTAGYVVARLVRRHRAVAAAAAVAVAALLAATGVSLRMAWSEARARTLSEQRLAEVGAVNAFLEQMLAAANPAQAQGRTVTVAEVLDEAERSLDEAASPVVAATVRRTLAVTRAALGDYERALELNDAALARAPAGDPDLRHGLLRVRGTLLTELGRFDEARAALDAAQAAWPAAPARRAAEVGLARARIDEEAGRPREAEAGYRALIAAVDAGTLDADDASVETARSNLLGQLRDSGRLDEALVLADQVLARRLQRDGARHPRTLSTRHNRASVLQAMGRLDEAVADASAVLADRSQVLGREHSATQTTAQVLANMHLERGELDLAEPLVRESLAFFAGRFGDDHAQALTSLNALAYLLEARGDVDEAETAYRRILALTAGTAGADSPAVLAPQNNLAMLLLNAGRLAAADDEFRDLLARTARALGPDHAYHAIFSSNHGLCLLRLGRRAQAASVLEEAHRRLGELMGADHARTRTAAERLQSARNGQDGAAR
jgi:tetratricopeptide (TPR) repeat protein/predicted Ser/Thr protein kinase